MFALVVTATHPGATVATDGVDLIDEDDTWRVLLSLDEEVSNTRRAHSHEHLYEVGTGDAEERNTGLTRDSFRQEGLSCSRGTNQEHSLGKTSSEAGKLLWIFKELDNLLKL